MSKDVNTPEPVDANVVLRSMARTAIKEGSCILKSLRVAVNKFQLGTAETRLWIIEVYAMEIIAAIHNRDPGGTNVRIPRWVYCTALSLNLDPYTVNNYTLDHALSNKQVGRLLNDPYYAERGVLQMLTDKGIDPKLDEEIVAYVAAVLTLGGFSEDGWKSLSALEIVEVEEWLEKTDNKYRHLFC